MLDVGVIGGGPAGLFAARLLLLRGIANRVSVYERNAADATFGFGVVFSDRTMAGFKDVDPTTYQRIAASSTSWVGMELRYRGTSLRYGGYGFAAIARMTLLTILREQAAEVGADITFHTTVNAQTLMDRHDLVVAADGSNSATRTTFGTQFGADVVDGAGRYVWFGTSAPFELVTFPFVETEHGAFAAHAYPYAPGLSTFIVETDTTTWRAAGMAESTAAAAAPGADDTYSQRLLADMFAAELGGRELLGNNSKWAAFRVVRNRAWSHRNVVLLGDAAHTAHFSIGSGTKLAMEDAVGLADAFAAGGRLPDVLAGYEARRRPLVARAQGLSRSSMRWWETFGSRMRRDPERFGFHFVTRTDAIGLAGLRRRHPERVLAAERAYAAESDVDRGALPVRFGDRRVTVVPGARLASSGLPAVEVGVDELTPGDVAGRLSGVPAATVIVGFRCPAGDARGPAGDRAVAFARAALAGGAAAAHVWGGRTATDERSWAHDIDLADRLRTEVGIPVLLDDPAETGDEADQAEWRDRVHTALVAGRIDGVVRTRTSDPRHRTALPARAGHATTE